DLPPVQYAKRAGRRDHALWSNRTINPGYRIKQDVTGLLRRWEKGDKAALEELMPLVYGELRRLAAHYLRVDRPDHTLQPTALVHEAYLRLVDQRNVAWQNRAHFFGIAAQMMRRVLVDHARRRAAAKRDALAYRIGLEGPDSGA